LLRRGMYPVPPNLSQEKQLEPRRAFWIIKHGIKLTAMPTWSKVLEDQDIWNIVAFLQSLPAMTPDAYQALQQRH
jgi:mono/diheme cytochrome c family protein